MTLHDPNPSGQSIGGILQDVATGFGNLVRGEISLARAEVAQGVRNATGSVVKFAVAAILALVALNVLTGAAVAALVSLGLGAGWASLIVALVLFLIAGGLVLSARAALDPANILPRRAMKNLRRDASAVASTLNTGV